MSARSFTFIREVARGGMASVHLAVLREGAFRRACAVKRLLPGLADDPAFLDGFVDEARIAGLLRHANVVSVLDVGRDEEGPFLVMDFIAGVPLSDVARAARPAGGLPVSLCLEICRQVADGLHSAHELTAPDGSSIGLVHRDVSPSNILLGFDGVARVADFGIAKAFGRIQKTQTGVLKGKLGYMAPEQLRFEEPDRRADLFSLGVVLYELLAGKRLYHGGEGYDGARRILNEPPPDVGLERDGLPPEVVELVFDLLAKDPADRPATAKAVSDRLAVILADLAAVEDSVSLEAYLGEHFAERRAALERELSGSLARAVSFPPPARARPRWMSVGVVVAALAVGAVGIWFVTSGRTASPPGASEVANASSPPPAPSIATVRQVEAPPTVAADDGGAEEGARTAPAGGVDAGAPTSLDASPETGRRAARRRRRPGDTGTPQVAAPVDAAKPPDGEKKSKFGWETW